jgi:plasmid stabilization system protein ParE
MKLRELAAATRELEDALTYYSDISERFAAALLAQIEATQRLILRFPLAGRRYGRHIRGMPLEHYPYSVIYRVDETRDEILIVAYAHHKRQPGYWRARSSGKR